MNDKSEPSSLFSFPFSSSAGDSTESEFTLLLSVIMLIGELLVAVILPFVLELTLGMPLIALLLVGSGFVLAFGLERLERFVLVSSNTVAMFSLGSSSLESFSGDARVNFGCLLGGVDMIGRVRCCIMSIDVKYEAITQKLYIEEVNIEC